MFWNATSAWTVKSEFMRLLCHSWLTLSHNSALTGVTPKILLSGSSLVTQLIWKTSMNVVSEGTGRCKYYGDSISKFQVKLWKLSYPPYCLHTNSLDSSAHQFIYECVITDFSVSSQWQGAVWYLCSCTVWVSSGPQPLHTQIWFQTHFKINNKIKRSEQ